MVALTDLKATKVNFPSAAGSNDTYLAMFQNALAKRGTVTIALDRLEANLAVTQAGQEGRGAVPVKNDPPRIYYRETPALLVLIDGDPGWYGLSRGGSGIERVINTRALILKAGGRALLHADRRPVGLRDLTARDRGQFAPSVPEPGCRASGELDREEDEKQTRRVSDLMRETSDDVQGVLAEGRAPEVIASTQPAELMSTQGAPG